MQINEINTRLHLFAAAAAMFSLATGNSSQTSLSVEICADITFAIANFDIFKC
jgi:hypothetical protein